MRLKHDRLIRPFALAAMLAMAVALVWGTGVGLAADFQEAKHNVCEGTFSPGSCQWGSHVTGGNNIALGDGMMPSLTSGTDNFASGTEALLLNTTGSFNIAFGSTALLRNTTGGANVALGTQAMLSNTTGDENIAIGFGALFSNKTGNFNQAIGIQALGLNTEGIWNLASGEQALLENTTGSRNVASGLAALRSNTTGNDNVVSGTESLFNNTTGSANVALGSDSGKNLTSGNNNIDFSNEGVAGEEGTTRIGTEGKQTKAYMAGIHSTSVSGCTVQVTAEGQLGCGLGTGGSGPTAIATFASFEGVASGHCIKYTELAGQGTGSCPGATKGFSMSGLLAGPTPAGGATVTNLYADSSATVKGSDTALVAVIDNTTGATLLSCTVNSTTVNHCSNTTESGSAGAGENIEVRVTATPANGSGSGKSWRVRFRY